MFVGEDYEEEWGCGVCGVICGNFGGFLIFYLGTSGFRTSGFCGWSTWRVEAFGVEYTLGGWRVEAFGVEYTLGGWQASTLATVGCCPLFATPSNFVLYFLSCRFSVASKCLCSILRCRFCSSSSSSFLQASITRRELDALTKTIRFGFFFGSYSIKPRAVDRTMETEVSGSLFSMSILSGSPDENCF